MYFSFLAETGKRHRWTVKVPARTLLACCEERMAYHTSRAVFWQKERESAETLLRSDGIKLRYLPVTGGSRTEASLDTKLAARVSECETRLKVNADAANRFRAFRAFLAIADSHAGTEIELNADDVLYFNLYFNLNGADDGSDDQSDEY